VLNEVQIDFTGYSIGMRSRDLYCVLIIFLTVFHGYSQELPRSSYGYSYVRQGEALSYILRMDYSLDERSGRSEQLSVILPPSDDFQAVEILEVNGAEIRGFLLDPSGNQLALLETGSERDKFSLSFEIRTFPSYVVLPKKFSYSSVPHEMLSEIFLQDSEEAFRDILEAEQTIIDGIKTLAPEEMGRNLFDPSILDLLPVSDFKFMEIHAEGFAVLRNEKLQGRLVQGIIAPKAADFFLSDFYVQYYVPNRGMLNFTKDLEEYLPRGDFISLWYGMNPGSMVVQNLEGETYPGKVEISLARNQVNYDMLFILPLSTQALELSSVYAEAQQIFTSSPDPVFKVKAVEEYVDQVVTAEGYAQQQPINPKSEFSSTERITAVIYIKEPGPNRNFLFRWIRPNGEIYYDTEIVPGANWDKFYTYVNSRSTKLETGIWQIEVYVNGTLDFRGQFLVQ
jgi:hypothetical protein